MQITVLQEFSSQCNRSCVCVGEESVLDHDARTAVDFEALDEVLQEEIGGLAGFDWEVFLDGVELFATEWWVGEHYMASITFLDLRDVFSEGIDMQKIRSINAMQDHVHDANDVRQAFLFFAKEG